MQPLFDERFVCLTRKERGVDGRRMGLRAYAAAEHVRVRVLDSARDPIDTALEARGITRNVALTVPHFSLVPLVVLRTGWVATMSERLARLYAGFLPLALRPPPFSLSARPVQMLWHERTHEDPAARFFRALVLEVSRR